MLIRKFSGFLLMLFIVVGISFPTVMAQDTGTSVAIAPLNGTVNTPLQIIANGFPPNSSVFIGVGVPASEYDVIGTAQTDAFGLVNTQIFVPSFFDTNTTNELVFVVGTDEVGYEDAISVGFTLMASDAIQTPIVNLVPRSGAAGSRVTVTATGFPPNEDIILGIAPQNGDFNYSLRETTDVNGNLITDVTIPTEARVNRNWVVLAEVEEDRDYQAFSPTFLVTGVEPTPLPDGSTFTQSDIYLIALGNTSAGETIGCGDSAVPVEVTYEPTVAPLTSSLETLFDIETRTYGQSGLYNVLYQSDLTLDSINIVDGLATIRIDGTLLVGGACDTPRVLAQIEQTATQFATIDEVQIFINGQQYQ